VTAWSHGYALRKNGIFFMTKKKSRFIAIILPSPRMEKGDFTAWDLRDSGLEILNVKLR
jgi:hypothetical protein